MRKAELRLFAVSDFCINLKMSTCTARANLIFHAELGKFHADCWFFCCHAPSFCISRARTCEKKTWIPL